MVLVNQKRDYGEARLLAITFKSKFRTLHKKNKTKVLHPNEKHRQPEGMDPKWAMTWLRDENDRVRVAYKCSVGLCATCCAFHSLFLHRGQL